MAIEYIETRPSIICDGEHIEKLLRLAAHNGLKLKKDAQAHQLKALLEDTIRWLISEAIEGSIEEWGEWKAVLDGTWVKPKVQKPKSSKLTDEQKAKFGPMLQQTWAAIAADCEQHLVGKRNRASQLIEIVCDANRPMDFGKMSKEEYKTLLDAYEHRDTKKWLREVLNY